MKYYSFPSLITLTCLSFSAVISWRSPAQGQVHKVPTIYSQVQPINPDNANVIRTNDQNNSLLSIYGGKRLVKEADEAIAAESYPLAVSKLEEARLIFNQLSNYYKELNASFLGIDNIVADSHRQKAIETVQRRDEASYQLALVHRSQNRPELAVPLLIEIITSQNPTRELGNKAYQQLLELGFVDAPYPQREGR